jgi:hypothetical protein
MNKKDEEFWQTVGGLAFAYLVFAWLKRYWGLPVSNPAATPAERVSEGLADLNRERVEKNLPPLRLM